MRSSLWSIFEGSKKRRFFDVDLEGQKIDKNRALEPQGPKKVQRGFAAYEPRGVGGPRAAANYQENRRKKAHGLRRRSEHAMGR